MIRAEHVSKQFDGRMVLDDVTATFETGKTNLIIGQSGSGKTVFLKSLVGLHQIDGGHIYYDDICYSSLNFKEKKDVRKQVGMLFQGAPFSTTSPLRRMSSFRSTYSLILPRAISSISSTRRSNASA